MVKKSSIALALVSGSAIVIVFGLLITSSDFNLSKPVVDEKTITSPSDEQKEIEKIWVEMYPIRCFDYTSFPNLNASIAGCYIEWLESYYGVKQFQPMYIKNYPQTSFQNNSNYIIDHFGKQGITIYDIKYKLVQQTLHEFGESWDDYSLLLLIDDSVVAQMLDLGFKISEKMTEEDLEKIDSKLEWKIVLIDAEVYYTDIGLERHTFKVPYKISNGNLDKIEYYYGGFLLNIKNTSSEGGNIEISIPRNLSEGNYGDDDKTFFVMIDREETQHNEVKSSCFRTVLVNFPPNDHEITISATIANYPIAIRVPDECIDKTLVKP